MYGKWGWHRGHRYGWHAGHWGRHGHRFWMPWPALGLLFLLLLGWKMLLPLVMLGILFFIILPAFKGAACDRPEGGQAKRKRDDSWDGEKRKNDDATPTFRTLDGEELEII